MGSGVGRRQRQRSLPRSVRADGLGVGKPGPHTPHHRPPDRLVDGTASQVDERTEADAVCIRDALTEYQPRVELEDAGWVVGIPEPQDLSVVLDVVRSCLDDNGIAMVKVTLDDHSYLMERRALADLRESDWKRSV